MAPLPAHLDRALHAACGRISEDGEEPIVATIRDIMARMGDPPELTTLQGWLLDLEGRALLRRTKNGWQVTKEGWRSVNRQS
jgi:hypothetical protein